MRKKALCEDNCLLCKHEWGKKCIKPNKIELDIESKNPQLSFKIDTTAIYCLRHGIHPVGRKHRCKEVNKIIEVNNLIESKKPSRFRGKAF